MLTTYEIEALKLKIETKKSPKTGILSYFADNTESVEIKSWQLGELLKFWEEGHAGN